jgi:Spy/CpxP family protein refolding chaperone
MKNQVTKVLIASILAASFAFAQNTHTPPDPATVAQRRVARYTTILTLTTAQQQQATNIFTNSATAGATLHTNLKTARQALSDAVKKNDTAGIDSAATTLGSLTAQFASTEGKADAAFYQILTPDQQTKLAALGGHGGRGMRGGPGGGANFRNRPQQ